MCIRDSYLFSAFYLLSFVVSFIEGLDHNLHILVLDEDPDGRSDSLGSVSIPMETFADQTYHDKWFDLVDAKGKKAGRLHLLVNFIYDLVRSLYHIPAACSLT